MRVAQSPVCLLLASPRPPHGMRPVGRRPFNFPAPEPSSLLPQRTVVNLPMLAVVPYMVAATARAAGEALSKLALAQRS